MRAVSFQIDQSRVDALSFGGAFLGGGGGGNAPLGKLLARRAFEMAHQIDVVSPEEVDPEHWVVTIAAVGAPSSPTQHVDADDYVRAVDLLQNSLDRPIGAFMANEPGGISIFNPFVPSAATGIPILDWGCNGRAHPIAVMGAMGLGKDPEYVSVQAASGGSERTGSAVELVTTGTLLQTSDDVVAASVRAGGLVAVARNPVSPSYVVANAAEGVVSSTLRIGDQILGNGPSERADRVLTACGGFEVARGIVTDVVVGTRGGLDVGRCFLDTGDEAFVLRIWNEYMTLECDGERLHTFPDLIVTLGADDGLPITAADLRVGQRLIVAVVPWRALNLGAGMRDREAYTPIERALGTEILPYVGDVLSSGWFPEGGDSSVGRANDLSRGRGGG